MVPARQQRARACTAVRQAAAGGGHRGASQTVEEERGREGERDREGGYLRTKVRTDWLDGGEGGVFQLVDSGRRLRMECPIDDGGRVERMEGEDS